MQQRIIIIKTANFKYSNFFIKKKQDNTTQHITRSN